MTYSLMGWLELSIGLLGGLYVAFIILKPTSKLDFFFRGSVGLITGSIFAETLSEKLELALTPAAFIASCGAWPVIGLFYRLASKPQYLADIIRALRK